MNKIEYHSLVVTICYDGLVIERIKVQNCQTIKEKLINKQTAKFDHKQTRNSCHALIQRKGAVNEMMEQRRILEQPFKKKRVF